MYVGMIVKPEISLIKEVALIRCLLGTYSLSLLPVLLKYNTQSIKRILLDIVLYIFNFGITSFKRNF